MPVFYNNLLKADPRLGSVNLPSGQDLNGGKMSFEVKAHKLLGTRAIQFWLTFWQV